MTLTYSTTFSILSFLLFLLGCAYLALPSLRRRRMARRPASRRSPFPLLGAGLVLLAIVLVFLGR